MDKSLRIGTRGSKLALKQADMVVSALKASGINTTIVPFVTTGDAITDRPLADIGGKGLFTKEIDRALLAGEVDCAVHSLKDMETVLADGIAIAACLERADPADRLIGAASLDDLKLGARVGTSAVRRKAALLSLRPDLAIVPLRGNVDTRLAKWRGGEIDATLLAQAGLDRLEIVEANSSRLSTDEFTPACGQGIIAMTAREGDEEVHSVLMQINHVATETASRAERAMLAELDGSCRSPIAAHATFVGDGQLKLTGALFALDGTQFVRETLTGSSAEPEALGKQLGLLLLEKAPPAVAESLK